MSYFNKRKFKNLVKEARLKRKQNKELLDTKVTELVESAPIETEKVAEPSMGEFKKMEEMQANEEKKEEA